MISDLNSPLSETTRGHVREKCRVAVKKFEWHQSMVMRQESSFHG